MLRINDNVLQWRGVVGIETKLDSIPWKNGGVCKRCVELGEVEHDVNKNERDPEHEDPKDEVESEEPENKGGEYFQIEV